MAKGLDELVDYLLSEIALCGVQGAGSADFRRFFNNYHAARQSPVKEISAHPPTESGGNYYESVWNWVINHSDIRALYQNEARTFSLSEFEALELRETGSNAAERATEEQPDPFNQSTHEPVDNHVPLADALPNLSGSLRGRLLAENHNLHRLAASIAQKARPQTAPLFQTPGEITSRASALVDVNRIQSLNTGSLEESDSYTELGRQNPYHDLLDEASGRRGARKIPTGPQVMSQIFEDPIPTHHPRLYASQDRIWQAIAGHSFDLKQLPSMHFVLLSIIRKQGVDGIAQPDLVRLSGQDKRSVPKRTDDLAAKGYIEKKPVYVGKVRTSICVHKRFVIAGHFLKSSGKVEDVFRNQTFILSSFVPLLCKTLKDNNNIVPVIDLRARMRVSVQLWKHRAIRTAILRLDRTGLVKRVRARKKGSKSTWLVCIKLVREPNNDDIKNLRSRRLRNLDEPVENIEEPLEEDEDGDGLMRDLDLDLELQSEDEHDTDDLDRIPPQWTPDRVMANLITETAILAGKNGVNGAIIRDKTLGIFWKRPLEAYLNRLTDNWVQSQPSHLLHLALIRDAAVTIERKFLHYIYRTYKNFEKAADAREVDWEDVGKKKPRPSFLKPRLLQARHIRVQCDKEGQSLFLDHEDTIIDLSGFQIFDHKTFLQRDHVPALSEGRASLARSTRNGQHWDRALAKDIGYNRLRLAAQRAKKPQKKPKIARKAPPKVVSLLTAEQRIALGLPLRGRLTIAIEKQVRAHRKKTGDPTAIPDAIVEDTGERPGKKKEVPPRLTEEEEKEADQVVEGLPETSQATTVKRKSVSGAQDELSPRPHKKAKKTKKGKKSSQQGGNSPRNVEGSAAIPIGKAGSASSHPGTPKPAVTSLERPSTQLPIATYSMGVGETTQPMTLENSSPEPVSTNLAPRIQSIADRFNYRSQPGVYINPSTTRSIGRGRPRKAFLIIIRSLRLIELQWFNSGRSLSKPKKTSQNSQPAIIPSSNTPQPSTLADTGSQIVTRLPPSPTPNNIIPAGAGGGLEDVQMTQSVVILPRTIPLSTQLQPTPTGWNAVNAPVFTPLTAYTSPYASTAPIATPQSPSSFPPVTQTQTPTNFEAQSDLTDVSIAALSPAGTPVAIVEERDLSRTPDIQNASNVESKIHRGSKSRRIGTGRGSVWRMRTEIIWSIIERCKGVFPLNGELVAPFHTLWEQRAMKNTPKPDRTTLTNTINGMIANPENKLKKLSFYVPGAAGDNLVEKSVVVYSHLTHESPEVAAVKASIRSAYPRKFYPAEIRHLVGQILAARRARLPMTDETVQLDPGSRSTAERLNMRIMKSIQNRMKATEMKKQIADEDRNLVSMNVDESSLPKERVRAPAKSRRLASLNHPPKESGHPIPQQRELQFSEDEVHPDAQAIASSMGNKAACCPKATVLSNPRIIFHDASGTFSTVFNPGFAKIQKQSGTKKVRILETAGEAPRKKPRSTHRASTPTLDDLHEDGTSESEEDMSEEETTEEETSEEETSEEEISKEERRPLRSAKYELPPLLDRLTGLTGNPNDPPYMPPVKKQYLGNLFTTKLKNRSSNGKQYPEVLDPADKFKRLCCALVIAASMSAEENSVDWDIVLKAYSSDPNFDLTLAKKQWSWMKTNMSSQINSLATSFESSFLTAYEKGQVASIHDTESYDWRSLVQWAVRTCKLPESPLPVERGTLHEYEVDESNYDAFDRVIWYQKNLATGAREQRMVQQTFASPLYEHKEPQAVDDVLRARSWIRSNTATPEDIYNGNMAHKKLSALGEPVLERTVTGFVNKKLLRMRHVKRQLPGRNYSFTATFAQYYRRVFELKEFMAAAKLKKDLDAAFARNDPQQQAFAISRIADDGAVMAICSLLSDGRIKLVPKLPPINSDFNSPQPKLSVWGFGEGDYVHRALDRNRFMWPVEAVPTPTYQFGNPLQPSPVPLAPTESGESANWAPLPDPPLPGMHDPNALLPIWSSIDGRTVIFPWWYRILNIVVQSLMFQPGATAAEVYRHCPEFTSELFEVELVLSWLVSVNAVKKLKFATFQVQPGYWAAFGDVLIDESDDWYGEHVKRKRTRQIQPTWRHHYNLRYSELRAGEAEHAVTTSEAPGVAGVHEAGATPAIHHSQSNNTSANTNTMTDAGVHHSQWNNTSAKTRMLEAQIVQHPRRQYRIAKAGLHAAWAKEKPRLAETRNQHGAQDVVMTDAAADDDEDMDLDLDAEGEDDDEMV
ncbi:hypothetical protein BDV95DRAFT_605072 [Massariosphaeria phaeospora]|uniref:Uncharacterized protein n=1 Tax=Massariosphaeria phaeospora TaxID=100035 RepID=A0A7C8MAG0_9PLEO|nr:hypothetical protein BDV95DRAFT_605072 [Massariosphaeria phaeospora]